MRPLLLFFPVLAFAQLFGNQQINTFDQAKKIAARIHADHETTVYCPCKYSGKKIDLASCNYQFQSRTDTRARRLEWEHIVPAENFGQSFTEWREGAESCGTQKGRKCAETNSEFMHMEAAFQIAATAVPVVPQTIAGSLQNAVL